MLTLQLGPILSARGINKPLSWLIKNGMNRHTATRLLNKNPREIRIDHLEWLCKILVCEPSDLFLWKQTNGVPLSLNHPLQKLVNTIPSPETWKSTLANMPFRQFQQFTQTLVEQLGQPEPEPVTEK